MAKLGPRLDSLSPTEPLQPSLCSCPPGKLCLQVKLFPSGLNPLGHKSLEFFCFELSGPTEPLGRVAEPGGEFLGPHGLQASAALVCFRGRGGGGGGAVLAFCPLSSLSPPPRGPHLHALSPSKGHLSPAVPAQVHPTPVQAKNTWKTPQGSGWNGSRGRGGGGAGGPGPPRQPTPASNSVPHIPAEHNPLGREAGRRGWVSSLRCPDPAASSPQAAGPEGPFCLDSRLQAEAAPGPSPSLRGTQKPSTAASPEGGESGLEPEQEGSQMGMSRPQGRLPPKSQETTHPSSPSWAHWNHGFSSPNAKPFSKERFFGLSPSLRLIMKALLTGQCQQTLSLWGAGICARAR